MRSRGFGNALVIGLISVGLMVGALSISLVEFAPQTTPTAVDEAIPSPVHLTATPTITRTPTPTIGPKSPTPSVSFTPTITSTASPSATPASSASPVSCQSPTGWGQIIIQAGDTLDSIAERYRTSKDALRSANCLLTDNLVAGTVLYAPPVATTTSAVCNPGAAGWVKKYVVKSGDTFYAIATNHYTTSSLLKSVNCRVSDLVVVGEILWVPNVATRTPIPYQTPVPGNTITPYPTDPLTETALPFTVTPVPTDTPIPPTPTAVPTFTPITPMAP